MTKHPPTTTETRIDLRTNLRAGVGAADDVVNNLFQKVNEVYDPDWV
jgi:hypothetical protein